MLRIHFAGRLWKRICEVDGILRFQNNEEEAPNSTFIIGKEIIMTVANSRTLNDVLQ
jgi:translation initiation factor 2B subunit (eIF-2B alpha/beta/delta family)